MIHLEGMEQWLSDIRFGFRWRRISFPGDAACCWDEEKIKHIACTGGQRRRTRYETGEKMDTEAGQDRTCANGSAYSDTGDNAAEAGICGFGL